MIPFYFLCLSVFFRSVQVAFFVAKPARPLCLLLHLEAKLYGNKLFHSFVFNNFVIVTIWTNWGKKIIGPFSQWPFSFSVPNRKNTVFANQNFCYTMFFYKREALVGFIIHLRFSLRLKHTSQFLTTASFVLSCQQANWHLQKHIKVTNTSHQIKKILKNMSR